jgi:two-component system cell cycle response regulator CtrA
MIHTDERVTRRLTLVRSQGRPQSVITAGKLAVNLDAKTVEADGNRVHLTRREYKVLELLSLRLGELVPKEAFMDHLYSGINEPKPKIIDVFVCKLRKKLAAAAGGDKCIETVWGCGYLLRHRVSEAAAATGTRRFGIEIFRSGHR